jgi:hypothetical protein
VRNLSLAGLKISPRGVYTEPVEVLLAMTVTGSVIASDSEAISVLLKLRSNFAL